MWGPLIDSPRTSRRPSYSALQEVACCLFPGADDERPMIIRGEIDVTMADIEQIPNEPFWCIGCQEYCERGMRVEHDCGARHYTCAICISQRCDFVPARGLTCHFCNDTRLTHLTCYSLLAFNLVAPPVNQ